ncbi:plasmid partitioning protein RepB C-terminal domain-containing protein [Variovorax sp. UMC13]|uniref:plasmid partitioning protein RepB C-terminal domain-containing protein n=1 Tax=Variovorax sp. UMC13 TaxID=1862326 RepID=UPI001601DCA0|nr:plasmid partitioning protein RepB C-terminal domain-containing protein [Variovorax sp. UMC13]MBB1601765.1 chromosome partitioning protein ParB [Variovorax sp. UMC13]
MSGVVIGFLLKPVVVNIENILPSRHWSSALSLTTKYKQIKASIEEVDLIEPLSVGPVDRHTSHHVLLDGHIRLMILRELGRIEAPCLVSTDDEAYTYNNRLNRLSTVQEHLMIRRGVDRGVSPDRLAKALNVDASQILKKINLLDGICPETTELLKDRQFSPEVFAALRRMKPVRQLECAELMISANNVTVAYARALLIATSPERLVNAAKAPRKKEMSQEQVVRMEKEMTNLHDQYKMAEQTYGDDMLNLVLARGYIAKLVDNKHVFRYLEQHESALLEQFVSITKIGSTEV